MGFGLKDKNGILFYTSKIIEVERNTRHFFSTRIGGASGIPYSSLNLGIYTSDREENIVENYRKILKANDMNDEKLVYLNQVHGDRFHVVDGNNYDEIRGMEGDALITTTRGIAIGVMTADCIPVIIVDNATGCAAAVHAGWKGTYHEIVKKVVQHMTSELGCSIENIKAAIGPGIGPCCFEVGTEVADKFSFVETRKDRSYVDLWRENERQLEELGVRSENIDRGELCTMCNNDKFYSYRGEKGLTGRLGAFVELV